MNYKKLVRSSFKFRIPEKIIRKFSMNKKYGSGLTKFIALHSEYTAPAIRNCKLNGINYSLDITHLVDWYIYFGFKEIEKEKLFSLIATGQMVIDVGANIGDMTLNFAKRVGETGRVISFEPFPSMFGKLMHNISLNTFKNISLNNLGLANISAELGMEEPSVGNPGMNRITSVNENQTTQIKVIRLDHFVLEQEIKAIDVIKIDVEGFEYEVLLGGKESIQKFMPILFIELDDDNLKAQGSSASVLIEHLLTIGYNIQNASNGDKIDKETIFMNCHFDILCTYSNKATH